MNWENIAGQENLKKLLRESIAENRVSHAQLFVGKKDMEHYLWYWPMQRNLSQENEHAASK
jgi:DNA polymerase-3 subunit delta'